ncbi:MULTISPECIES: helix-turn-helix domain-containing protein [unclassified Kribbella]
MYQHLVGGPVTISTLAELLGVTQQAASKTVADLEKRG